MRHVSRLYLGVLLVVGGLGIGACTTHEPEATAGAVSPEEGRAAVMQADRDFAAATAERGIDGWMAYMAPDAVRVPRLGQNVLRGLDAIRAADAPLFADTTVQLTWEPVDGGVFSDGRHGFTTGRYTLWRLGADGTRAEAGVGAYVSFWRQEPNGAWRVLLDGGAADPPA